MYFNWRLITLQYCSGLCHTLTWISYGCICVNIVKEKGRELLFSWASHIIFTIACELGVTVITLLMRKQRLWKFMTNGHKTCMGRSQEVRPGLPDSRDHRVPSVPGAGGQWGLEGSLAPLFTWIHCTQDACHHSDLGQPALNHQQEGGSHKNKETKGFHLILYLNIK